MPRSRRDPLALPGLFESTLSEEFKWSLPEMLFCFFPAEREQYLDAWCRLAERDGQIWDEVLGLHDRLVARGEDMPECLAQFAVVPRPRRRGRRRRDERDVRLQRLVDALLAQGYSAGEIQGAYWKAFPPESELRDPDESWRKLISKHSEWLARPGSGCADAKACVSWAPPELPDDDDWSDPVETVRGLLGGARPVSPMVLLWHLWPQHRGDIARWGWLAVEKRWLWDELLALRNWLVFTGRHKMIPWPVRRLARLSPPANPPHRAKEYATELREALLAGRLEECGEQRPARILVEAHPGTIDESSVHRHIFSGRNEMLDLLRWSSGSDALPWEASIHRQEPPMQLRRFEPDRYYRPDDPELAPIGTPGTLAHRRYRGVGPRYVAWGNRVFYRGSDLNAFLDEHVVELPGDAADGPESGSAGFRSAGGSVAGFRDRRDRGLNHK